MKFITAGFPRVYNLPNCLEGQLVLRLVEFDWDRMLLFTVGTTLIPRRANCIIWNNVHQKAESSSNYSGHGFPERIS